MSVWRNPRARIAPACLAALLACLPATPGFAQGASNTVGIAAALVRDVKIKPATLKAFAAARLRQRIAIADQLRTGADSRLQIALLDKTKVTLGANAQLTVDKFIYDPNGGSVTVTTAKGAMRFMSGSQRSAKTVNTPSATIGVRGTVFDTAVGELAVEIARRERAVPPGTPHDPATATFAVLRGPGPNRQGKVAPGAIDVTAAGQTVVLEKPLMAAYVPYAGATPIGPFSMSTPSLIQLNEVILPPGPRGPTAPASPGQGQPVPSQFRQNGSSPPSSSPSSRSPNDPPPGMIEDRGSGGGGGGQDTGC